MQYFFEYSKYVKKNLQFRQFARCCLTGGIQRGGGLAQRRLSLHVLRATSVHVRTSLSAEWLPPLRQTARC